MYNNGFLGYNFPYNGYQSTYGAYQQGTPQNLPRYEITHVNGANGANAFRMAANSNTLLLDDTAPIVWLAQTDGAGYMSLTPYSITPYQQEAQPDFKSFETRLKRLEEMMNEQSNNAEIKSKRSGRSAAADE